MDHKEMEKLRKIARVNQKKRLEEERIVAEKSKKEEEERKIKEKKEFSEIAIEIYKDVFLYIKKSVEKGVEAVSYDFYKRAKEGEVDAVIELLESDGFFVEKRLLEYDCSAHGYGGDDVGSCECCSYWNIKVWGWL